MRQRSDGLALVTGLLFALLAVIGLWMAFGTVSWAALGIVLPLCLVAFGVIGLVLSRSPKP